jgi:formiminotetrahydrofolate cyclodeaminase
VQDYLDLPLRRFLDLTASSEPAPGGGAAAAVTVSLAAALAGMAARLSTDLPDVAGLIERTDYLREASARLARADAEAYGRVIAAKRTGTGIKEALSDATDVPLAIAEAGAEVQGVAARLAEDGNPNLRGDALTAVLLAGAAVRAAASLVEINLSAAGIADGRLDRVWELAESAAEDGA